MFPDKIRLRYATLLKSDYPSAVMPHSFAPAPHLQTRPAYSAPAPAPSQTEQNFDHLFKIDGPDTKTKHSVGGQYTPERQELHSKIVSHYLNGGDHGDDHDLHQMYADHAAGQPQKAAVFTMGGAGSGKSYYAKRKFLKHPRFVSVDPDAIKEHLAAAEGKPGDHNTNAPAYHEESSDIAKHLQAAAHAAGKSYVLDGTGAGADSLAKKMKAAKEAGYQVHLHYGKVDIGTALERDKKRARSLSSREGGEAFMRHQHAQVAQSFGKVRHMADKVKVVDLSNRTTSNPYAERRAQILAQKQEQPMEKAVGHDLHGKYRIHLKPHHTIVGNIINGHVHVEDSIHKGTSMKEVLGGTHHGLRPITVAYIKQHFPEAKFEKE